MEYTNYLLSLYEQSRHTKKDIYLKFLEVAHANLLRTIGYIGRYGGLIWNNLGFRILMHKQNSRLV